MSELFNFSPDDTSTPNFSASSSQKTSVASGIARMSKNGCFHSLILGGILEGKNKGHKSLFRHFAQPVPKRRGINALLIAL